MLEEIFNAEKVAGACDDMVWGSGPGSDERRGNAHRRSKETEGTAGKGKCGLNIEHVGVWRWGQ